LSGWITGKVQSLGIISRSVRQRLQSL